MDTDVAINTVCVAVLVAIKLRKELKEHHLTSPLVHVGNVNRSFLSANELRNVEIFSTMSPAIKIVIIIDIIRTTM